MLISLSLTRAHAHLLLPYLRLLLTPRLPPLPWLNPRVICRHFDEDLSAIQGIPSAAIAGIREIIPR